MGRWPEHTNKSIYLNLSIYLFVSKGNRKSKYFQSHDFHLYKTLLENEKCY